MFRMDQAAAGGGLEGRSKPQTGYRTVLKGP